MKVEERNVLVVGFARSGLAAANFLLSRGAQVTVTDLRPERELSDSVARLVKPARLSLGGHDVRDFLSADFIVLSPGVPSSLPELREASEKNIPVYSEVELAYRFLEGPLIGVTGSNGKTTTTMLIGELFKAADKDCVVAGNIGSPLIRYVDSPSSSLPTTFVVELSSFQLENIEKLKCDTALLLNISPDHLDRYAHFSDYVSAKERIFLNQTARDYAVLNADNPHAVKMSRRRDSRVVLFSSRQKLDEGVFVQDGTIRIVHEGQCHQVMPVGQLRLRGSHNLENVLAATAAGFLSGLEQDLMADAFRNFAGVEHRLEPVLELDGIGFYNDSKATNIDSAQRAIEAFSEPVILIMGGQDKGADFSLLRAVTEERVKCLLLLGAATDTIFSALGEAVPTARAKDMDHAVELAYRQAVKGDVVLLAPGCASFDMFEDFEHRGRAFKEAVAALAAASQREKKKKKHENQGAEEQGK